VPAIALLGDVMLGRVVAERLREVPAAELWSEELRELLRGCDAVVCNLECCISARGHPTERIPGKSFFFRAPPAATDSLEAIGGTVATLANNHALDFETEALLDSFEHLREAGIATCGAGVDRGRARAGQIVEVGGISLGIAAFSDHPVEFAAGEGQPGIAYAPLGRGLPGWLAAELGRLRERCDQVLAFPHWGPNMTDRPSRWQRELADELLAAGATALAGHSSHVFHGVALRPGGPVLFDLGDALDDYWVDPRLRNDRSVCAIWRPGGEPEIELVGLRLELARTEIAAGEDAEWLAKRIERACRRLGTAVERTAEARFRLSAAD
jgi:poly-gamma-glutamate capsule biosynthesis protein CapA/YwtB (metallophosphatase superfamily)